MCGLSVRLSSFQRRRLSSMHLRPSIINLKQRTTALQEGKWLSIPEVTRESVLLRRDQNQTFPFQLRFAIPAICAGLLRVI